MQFVSSVHFTGYIAQKNVLDIYNTNQFSMCFTYSTIQLWIVLAVKHNQLKTL